MAEMLSGNALSKRLGISETMVRKYRDQGLFIPKNGLYDVEICERAYKANRDPTYVLNGLHGAAPPGAKNGSTLPENSLTKVRTIQAGLKAQREQLALQKAKGELNDRREAQRAALIVVREITQRLSGLPAAAAPVVHAAPSVQEAEVLLRGMVRTVLLEVARLGDVFDEPEPA